MRKKNGNLKFSSSSVNDKYPGVSSYSKTINKSALFSIMGFINVPSILSVALGWNQVLEKAEEWMNWAVSQAALGKSG